MKIEEIEIPKEMKDRHKHVNRRLSQLWSEDEVFKDEFQGVFEYYKAKLAKVLGNRVKHDDFLDGYFTYVTDLFYQGYYLGKETVEHKEVKIADRFFQQPVGAIKEQVYDLLEGVTGDLIQVLSHEDSADFEMVLIQENESVQSILMQIKKDIACLGALQAILDEKDTKGLSTVPEFEDEYKGLLYRSDDLFFVDPQKYFICLLTDNHSEVWDLCLWSTVSTRNNKVGEVHISTFEANKTNEMIKRLPYYQGYEAIKTTQKNITVTLSLTQRVDEKEQFAIVGGIVESLKNRLNIGYENVNVTLVITEELHTYKYEPAPNVEAY